MTDAAESAVRTSGEMIARDIQFQLGPDAPRHLCPSQPEFSHATAAFMAALPHLEPYFIHNIREAAAKAAEPKLEAETRLFVAQEARHAQQHRAYNAMLGQHYTDLPRLERQIKQRLDRSRKQHSLAYRMAYTAGYEAITYHLIAFIMEQRRVWLSDAHPGVLAMLCWHGAEEVEHKSVAFDAYQAVHGGYWLRIFGLLSALAMTVKDLHGMLRYMLQVDGLWPTRACQRRLRRVRLAFLAGFVPRLFGYFRPSYHPSRYPDPPSMLYWIRRHAEGHDLSALTLEGLDEPGVHATLVGSS